MANGDAAIAAGMDVVAATADLRQGYDEINKSRDYTANHQTAGTHPASAITSGTLAEARIPNLPASKITSGALAAARIPDLDGSKITTGSLPIAVNTSGAARFGAAYEYNIVTTRRAMWMDVDGAFGYASSSRRYKQNIRPADIDVPKVLSLKPSTFEYRTGGMTDSGLIAEDVAKAGLEFCVDRTVDGVVEGIHYDRLTVALLAVAQAQQKQIDELTALVQRQIKGAL